MRIRFIFLCVALLPTLAMGVEVMPPKPAQYFNDYAHVTSSATASELNQQLEQFERDSSSQILVAVYPKMESDSSIEDYTVRIAQSWGVGQKGKDNGAVLFVFVQDHKMYIQVGYGLEGALPDGLAKLIIENEIKPRFRNGDFDGGLRAGVTAMLQATKGEYKGTGRIVGNRPSQPSWLIPLVVFVIFIIVSRLFRAASGGTVYSRSGRIVSSGLGGMWFGGGGSSGGGGFSGGGGGFSGGGGSFGGGGAGGSW
jgi:uncharacterized protein